MKLLDFGLAKLTEASTAIPSGATATMTAPETPQTEEGTIVGTVAYMSPEQAEGRKVDARSDIFSFGSVLYEMVTGRRPFEGATKISTLSAILHKEPQPPARSSPNLPAELEKIISRCLRKDPDRRAQHIGRYQAGAGGTARRIPSRASSRAVGAGRGRSPARAPALASRRSLSGAAVVLAAAGAFWWAETAVLPPRRAPIGCRSRISPDSVSQPALSPDGRMLTFIRGSEHVHAPGQVYVKMLPSGDPVQLTHDDLARK